MFWSLNIEIWDQASLDLTDLGYFVYLVEKSASIGGVMARLDKTFPTNDCAI
jgi:heterodisulfide reductase subunit A